MTARRRAMLLGAAAWSVAGATAGAAEMGIYATKKPGAVGETPAPLRLLCFGDSLMAGPGLAPPDRFPAQLAGWLEGAGAPPLRMRVAALSGDTSYGGRVRIGPALRRSTDAVLVAIGANDMLLGWSAARAEANLDAILARAGQGGRPLLLLGVGAVGGDADFRAGWDAIWPRLAARHGALLVPDLYARIRAEAGPARAALLQADGLHANAAGTALMVETTGPQALALARAAAALRDG